MHWKPVPNFPNYEASKCGNVRRIGKSKNLSTSKKTTPTNTYLRITLFKEGERHYHQLHRIIALTHLPNPLELSQVDHIDNDGTNNRIENLEWVSPSENIKRSFNRNPKKLLVCSSGGKQAAITMENKLINRLQLLLKSRFVQFHSAGKLHKDPAITYNCECGNQRTAVAGWKEIRNHGGKCPQCTNTVKRSSKSLL